MATLEGNLHNMVLLPNIQRERCGLANQIVGTRLYMDLNQGFVVGYGSAGLDKVEVVKFLIENKRMLLRESQRGLVQILYHCFGLVFKLDLLGS